MVVDQMIRKFDDQMMTEGTWNDVVCSASLASSDFLITSLTDR